MTRREGAIIFVYLRSLQRWNWWRRQLKLKDSLQWNAEECNGLQHLCNKISDVVFVWSQYFECSFIRNHDYCYVTQNFVWRTAEYWWHHTQTVLVCTCIIKLFLVFITKIKLNFMLNFAVNFALKLMTRWSINIEILMHAYYKKNVYIINL